MKHIDFRSVPIKDTVQGSKTYILDMDNVQQHELSITGGEYSAWRWRWIVRGVIAGIVCLVLIVIISEGVKIPAADEWCSALVFPIAGGAATLALLGTPERLEKRRMGEVMSEERKKGTYYGYYIVREERWRYFVRERVKGGHVVPVGKDRIFAVDKDKGASDDRSFE